MKRLLSLVVSPGARDTYILTAGNITDSVIAFLFTIISFKLLSDIDFGLFSAYNNLIFSASLILDMGLSQALLFYLPNLKGTGKNITIGSAIALRLLIASVFSLILIIFANPLSSKYFSGSSPSLITISALAIIFASLIDVLVYSLQGLHKFLSSILVSNTYSLTRLIAVLTFSRFSLNYSAFDALFITVYGPIIGIMLALILLKPLKPSFGLYKKLLGFGCYMSIYRICQIISLRSDVQIVLIALGASSAATYSVAARMGNFYPLIIITLNSLFASRLRLLSSITVNFIKKSILLTFVVLVAMLFCAWQAPLIINMLFGAKGVGAGLIYRYLTIAYLPLMTATLPISILIFFHSQTKFVALLGLVQVFTMLVSSYLLVPRYSQYGPIISLAIANSLVFILSCYKVIRIWKLE